MKKFIYLSILLNLLFISYVSGEAGIKPPKSVNGILDLSKWDFEKQGAVKLEGKWRFKWNEFTAPDKLLSDQNTYFIDIPSYWNNFNHDGEKLPGKGFASYQLKIILPENDIPLALDIHEIFTSYRLYVDEKLVASAGSPGKSSETTEAQFRHAVSTFTPDNKTILLTIHASNYDLEKGGLWTRIILGDVNTIIKNSTNRLAFEIFIISSIIIMGIYHLGIFFYRKNDKTALYFAVFCILLAVRALTTGEYYLLKLFPGLPWTLLIKLEYFCFYAALPFFLTYMYSLFPEDAHKKVITTFQIAAAVFSLQVILTPAVFFNKTLVIYQFITAAAGLYSVYILIRAVFYKRSSSLILLAGFIVMFLAFLNDVFHANEIIHTGFILPAGLFIFIISQAILILNQYAVNYNTIEQQKNELITNHDLLVRSRMATILGLAKLSECRDENTGSHLERIREYCRLIAGQLALTDEYKNYITNQYIEDLYQSSILHDIGKVGIPDAILLKKGRLEADEFEVIKQHAKIGGDAILNIESQTGMKTFLTLGKEIAWYHHEKWDGSGYPEGLKEEKIPLSARITALVDVYDALTSERPYKKAFTHEKAKEIIVEGRGSHFDPKIVDIFLELEAEFNKLKLLLNDN